MAPALAMVNLLEVLVRAELPSSDPRSQWGWRQLLGTFLDGLDFRIRPVGERLLVMPWGEWRRSSSRQLLLGHGYTVWP